MIAYKETQNCFGKAGLRKALQFALQTSHIVGWWKEGKLYFDAVMVTDDEVEAERLMIENEQIAIYHLQTFTYKRNPKML